MENIGLVKYMVEIINLVVELGGMDIFIKI